MSILLEALKKSENSQRTREAPTIHSEVPTAPPGRFANRLIIGVLLFPTLVICTWLAWLQYSMPKSDNLEMGTAAARPVAEETARPAQPKESPTVRPRAGVAAASPGQSVSSGGGEQRAVTESALSASRASGQRTPVESYRPPAKSEKEDAGSSQPAVSARSVKPFGAKNSDFGQTTSSRESAGSSLDGSGQEDEPVRPQEPEMLGYWDLPDNVRASIPEFNFTVLVYDKKPENRFVLINGERYVEGDAQQPGLVVEEIRREGVVYSYRLYRFLVEK